MIKYYLERCSCYHFFAFLRIGELVVASSNDKNTLTLDNVCLDSHGKNVLISFSRSKHSKGRMHSLSIQQRTHNCPVEAFRTYISLMGAVSGYLFLDHMGKPINHLKFKTILSKYLVFFTTGSIQIYFPFISYCGHNPCCISRDV